VAAEALEPAASLQKSSAAHRDVLGCCAVVYTLTVAKPKHHHAATFLRKKLHAKRSGSKGSAPVQLKIQKNKTHPAP
jgi:hypothetical protein